MIVQLQITGIKSKEEENKKIGCIINLIETLGIFLLTYKSQLRRELAVWKIITVKKEKGLMK